MSWAAKSCPDAERDFAPEPPRQVRIYKEPPAPLDLKLTEICERGAYFCPRCHKFRLLTPGRSILPPLECVLCGREMKWCPPIF